MSKTALWDKLGKTDPAHTKTFKRAGGFSGTAIKPMWSYRRMTEEFGPCGVGWGINAPSFQVVPNPASEEILVYCTVSIWHEKREQIVFGVGGDKVAGKNKYGAVTDDEAFKKAFTDAITNAMKLIGVGADVHMGMFDDNKYVNTVADEFKEQAKSSAALKRDDAWTKAMADLEQDMLDVGSEAALEALRASYISRATNEGWTQSWKESLADEFLKRKDQIREASLWDELNSLTTLHGLKTFWEDNSPAIKALGPFVLKTFTAKKNQMKLIMEANNSPLSAG